MKKKSLLHTHHQIVEKFSEINLIFNQRNEVHSVELRLVIISNTGRINLA